mmetsp:Transcript_3223/g.9158  ORF Transcript_3223/g.9158 Transcript_3223/m.9158 type:complete len:261 (-) Transcript_3223:1441-2223(-)
MGLLAAVQRDLVVDLQVNFIVPGSLRGEGVLVDASQIGFQDRGAHRARPRSPLRGRPQVPGTAVRFPHSHLHVLHKLHLLPHGVRGTLLPHHEKCSSPEGFPHLSCPPLLWRLASRPGRLGGAVAVQDIVVIGGGKGVVRVVDNVVDADGIADVANPQSRGAVGGRYHVLPPGEGVQHHHSCYHHLRQRQEVLQYLGVLRRVKDPHAVEDGAQDALQPAKRGAGGKSVNGRVPPNEKAVPQAHAGQATRRDLAVSCNRAF